jgi:hypothetical protein
MMRATIRSAALREMQAEHQVESRTTSTLSCATASLASAVGHGEVWGQCCVPRVARHRRRAGAA